MKHRPELSRRERQFMDVLYARGRCTVAEVMEDLPDPPSYSAVRATLRILEEKGHVYHEQDGPRYVYIPQVETEEARTAALNHLVTTFFDGSEEEAVVTLLKMSDAKLSDAEVERLRDRIRATREKGAVMIGSMITWMVGWTSGMADLFMSAGIRGVVFLALILAVTAAMRSASAATRHAMLAAGVLGVLAMPFAALLPLSLPILPALPAFEMTAPAAPQPTAAAVTAERTTIDRNEFAPASAAPAYSTAFQAPTATPPAGSGAARLPVELLLAGLWGLGTLVLASRSLWSEWTARRLVAGAAAVEDAEWKRLLWESADLMDVGIDVRLLRSDASAVAFTMGAVQPVIVIPASSDDWTEDRRRAVLLHELAHIRRRDVVLHNLGRLVTVMYWFNPLVWIAAARLRSESERAADDLVLRGGTRPSDYADHLLQIVTGTSAFPAPSPVLPFARKREFEGRIMAVLEAERPRSALSATHRAAVVGGVALLAIPLASLSAATDTTEAQEPIAAENRNGTSTGFEADIDMDAHVDVDVDTDVETQTDVDVQEDEVQPDPDPRPSPLVALMNGIPPRFDTPALRRALEAAMQASGPGSAGALDDPRAIAALIERLLNDSDAEVRFQAAFALGELEAEEAVDALSQAMLNDAEMKVRAAAAMALGEIESPSSVDALLRAAGDSDVDVRRAAMVALGEIEDPASLNTLVTALSDSDPDVRARAAFAIGEIEPDTAPPELVRLLDDSDAGARRHALRALAEIQDPATADAMVGLLDDADPEVRAMAIDALMDMDGVGIEPLLRALEDSDPDVRRRAARALGDL